MNTSTNVNNVTPTTNANASSAALDPNAVDCKLALPANALTAEGLSTPWELLPPCSQAVAGQQAFAEAAVIDSSGKLSVYHPLIIDQGKTPAVAPIVPNLGTGAQVALFFGFNGNTLTLVDTQGRDTNSSPDLAASKCVNGLPGAKGDVFGQVSWCNTEAFWNAANNAVSGGQLQVPQLGTDNNGNQCLSSRSFEIIDQDQSDNLPTKYLLLQDGTTVQFTAANQKQFPQATEIDNASDEALIADFVDPVIGCTPFKIPSLDDPGSMVSSMASQELQALLLQKEPIALVPLTDPDTLLTATGATSTEKTNAYRQGVNMPLLGNGAKTDAGSGTDYCNNLVAIQPPFLAGFQEKLTAATTPDATVGNNLFTFLANRFLQSLVNLNCPNKNIPVTCQLDSNGVATACSITALSSTGNGTTVSVSAAQVGTGTAASMAGKSTASDLAPSSAFTQTNTHSRHIKSHNFGTTTVPAAALTHTASVSATTGNTRAASTANTSAASASFTNVRSSASNSTSTPIVKATTNTDRSSSASTSSTNIRAASSSITNTSAASASSTNDISSASPSSTSTPTATVKATNTDRLSTSTIQPTQTGGAPTSSQPTQTEAGPGASTSKSGRSSSMI